jgi:hypothetical protein
MSHYKITPLDKKSIQIVYEMFRENDDGTISWFNIDETYRWGFGFIEEDLDCNLPVLGDLQAWAKPDAGEFEGCEFEDSIACYFEFSDDISAENQEHIKESYYEGGAGWLFEGDHNWQEEDSYVIVTGPYRIDFVDENGTVIREVCLRTRDEIIEIYERTGEYVSKDSALPLSDQVKDN